MDFLNILLDFASKGVALMGAGIGVLGLTKYGEGKSQHNAGAQEEGFTKIVGGVFIIIIGLELVPQIVNLF